jgi:predicted nucleic acid-binding protein
MACLDTSFLIDLLRGRQEVHPLKDELDRTEAVLAIAAPSIMELWAGAELAKVPGKEKERIAELLTSLTVLPLDEQSAKAAGETEAELLRKGSPIETEDIMTAGIARAHGEKVVTRDAHYTRIIGLRVLKY